MNNQGQPFEILDSFLFPKIFQTFRIAIQPGKLLIAFFAVAVICLAGWLMDFSKTVVVTPEAQGRISELQVYLNQPERISLHINGYKFTGTRAGVFSTLWDFTAVKFQNSVEALLTLNLPAIVTNINEFIKSLDWAFRYHFAYSIVLAVIIFIVISFAGGAICRLAGLQFARGEKAGFAEAMQFSKSNFASFFVAPLAPVSIIIFIGLLISVLGVITNIPYAGELITAFGTPFALAGGLLVTILLVGTVAGFNLMFPAVACDGSDFFDADSKALGYIYAKPWRMGFYTVIAAAYGAICYTFIRFCMFLLLSATHLFLQLATWMDSSSKETNKLTAIWPEPEFRNLFGLAASTTTSGTEHMAAVLIHLSLLVIVGLLAAFIISFYFCGNTIIYTLIRNRVDNTPLNDIYVYPSPAKSDVDTAQEKPKQTPENTQ